MPGMLAFAAPIALLLPILGHSAATSSPGAESPVPSSTTNLSPPKGDAPIVNQSPVSPFNAWSEGQIARQVRIQQRVIIRISPARPAQRRDMLAQLPPRQATAQFEERQIGKCLAVEGIAGVQTDSGNRLILFLRDRRIISINLEKACRARDFYSGFYVERNEDGQVCVDRDKLLSRNGAKCEIDRMRQLVAVTE